MAIIKCSECGRAVSNKAAACIGCGAPLTTTPESTAFNAAPTPSMGPPPSRNQRILQGGVAVLMLAAGIIWANAIDHRAGSSNKIAATIAALLIICGLCGSIVTLVQGVAPRK